MSQVKYPSKLRYEYSMDPSCSLNYAHGVWGGINPQGEIEVNFYVESDKVPSFSERPIMPDGAYGEENVPFDEDERVISRRIHSRILFNYNTARAFLDWLEEKVEALEMEESAAYSGEEVPGVSQ